MHTEYKHSSEANGEGLRREERGGETFAFPLVPSVLSAHSLSSVLSCRLLSRQTESCLNQLTSEGLFYKVLASTKGPQSLLVLLFN